MRNVIVVPPLNHVSYTHEAADGSLRAWDVTRGNQIAADGRAPLLFGLAEHGVTPNLVCQLYPGLDTEHAMTTDLTRPLLVIPFSGECVIIDGWHRLYRAAVEGVADVLIFLLTQAEADAIQWLHLPPGHGINWRD
jgi:hypothetical protein